MEFDDIVYLSLLFFSIGFGHFYRQIKNPQQKKILGTLIGLVIVFIVSGFHIIHPLITTLISSFIVLYIDKKKCHLYSFIFNFGYLLFFRTTIYFGLPYPPAHTNLIQMMLTLKMIGLACEIEQSELAKTPVKDAKDKNHKELSYDEIEHLQVKPDLINIFHYSFNYVGVLTGPYFKYRTFIDSIEKPYAEYVNCNKVTLNKIQIFPLFGALFLILTYLYPISYIHTNEFYEQRHWLYRLWYVVPTFAWFRMRIYIGLTLSECVCTMAGFGVYPAIAQSKSGEGPTTEYKALNEITGSDQKLKESVYDFETIHNINPYGSEFCTTFRDGMKNWNMCIQYWLVVNVYKRVSKKYRIFATAFASAAWHGVYLGHFYCLMCIPFYLAVEDVYMKTFRKHTAGTKAAIWDFFIWLFKMQGFAYFGFAFHLLSIEKTFKFYNSIYHFGEVVLLVLYVAAIGYKQVFPNKKPRVEEASTTPADVRETLAKNE